MGGRRVGGVLGGSALAIVALAGPVFGPGVAAGRDPDPVMVCGRDPVPAADALAVSDQVTPPRMTGTAPMSLAALGLRAAANDAARNLLQTRAVVTWARAEATYLDRATLRDTAEGSLRLPAADAYSLAVLLATRAYDEQATGRERAWARALAIWLLRSVACVHRANGGPGWVTDWANASWAGLIGEAAWFLWSDLTLAERVAVVRVVRAEADEAAASPSLYYADAEGRILRRGDTAIEEMSWRAELLWLAVAMFPSDPNEAVWTTEAVRASLAALSMPADPASTEWVNGRTVGEWVQGSNVLDNGFVVNHGILHPQYSALLARALQPAVLLPLAGRPVPDAVVRNADVMYGALSSHEFSSPPYQGPGGTVYVPGSAAVYLPQGSDWGTVWPVNLLVMDTAAALFRLDGLAAEPARRWQALHLAHQRELQARADDGRTRQEVNEYSYRGAESSALQYLATAWLGEWTVANRPVRRTDADLVTGTLPPGRVAPIAPPGRFPDPSPTAAPTASPGLRVVPDAVGDPVALVGRRPDPRADIVAVGRTQTDDSVRLAVRPRRVTRAGDGVLTVTWLLRRHVPGPVRFTVSATRGMPSAPVYRTADGTEACRATVTSANGLLGIDVPRTCFGPGTQHVSVSLDYAARTGAVSHDVAEGPVAVGR